MFVEQANDKICFIGMFSLIDYCHTMKTGAELVRNISVVWQVWMQNMIRVRFDAVE